MPSDRHTGAGGTTVWGTEAAARRIAELAQTLPARAGRGADRRVGDAMILVLEQYAQAVHAVPAPDRPCFAGTLIGYPGAAYSGRQTEVRGVDGWTTQRRGETKLPGSKRLFLRPDGRDLIERLTQYGLVLDHQQPRTRPAGLVAHPKDPKRDGIRTGRPLTDVLLTAVILSTGQPLDDEPIRAVEWQVLRQSTAQQLWTIAAQGLDPTRLTDRRTAQARLTAVLPTLLSGSPARRDILRRELPAWQGSLAALQEAVHQQTPQAAFQAALAEEVVPV